MRCMACGAEMILVHVVADETMIVSGFERYTLQCLGCDEVEHRFVFTRQNGARDAQAGADGAGASPPSSAAGEKNTAAASSAWARTVKTFRSRQAAIAARATGAKKTDRVGEFYRNWENPIPPRRRPVQLLAPPKPKPPSEIKAAVRASGDEAGERGAAGSAWARAVAKLRQRQERS